VTVRLVALTTALQRTPIYKCTKVCLENVYEYVCLCHDGTSDSGKYGGQYTRSKTLKITAPDHLEIVASRYGHRRLSPKTKASMRRRTFTLHSDWRLLIISSAAITTLAVNASVSAAPSAGNWTVAICTLN
jgi:hypothetical protein